MKVAPFLVAVLVLGVLAPCNAQIVAQHLGSADPTTEHWLLAQNGYPNLTAGPIYNDLGTGIDSWTVKDNNIYGGGGSGGYDYAAVITNAQASMAFTQGWKLDARIRVVNKPDNPSDFSVYFGFNLVPPIRLPVTSPRFSRIFSMALGSTPSGDPIVHLVNSSTVQPQVVDLTLDGAGSGYHLYEFQFDPVSQTADISVDGQLLLADYSGFTNTTSNAIVWGTLDAPLSNTDGTGQGNYNLVQLEIVPEPPALVLATIAAVALMLYKAIGHVSRA